MSRTAAPSAVKKPRMAMGEAASLPGCATSRAPVIPTPISARRSMPMRSPKNSQMPSSTRSGAICAMAVMSAIGISFRARMKLRMAKTSHSERSATQRLKTLGRSRPCPRISRMGRHQRQAAMPRMIRTCSGGASDSASFMQLSLATKAPVASSIAPIPRRLDCSAIRNPEMRLPDLPTGRASTWQTSPAQDARLTGILM